MIMSKKSGNKISHQVRISEHEALILMLALFWLGQYCPQYRTEAARYFSIFDRVLYIIRQKKNSRNLD